VNGFQGALWVIYLIGTLGLVTLTLYLLRHRWALIRRTAIGVWLLCFLLVPGPVGTPALGWAPGWIVFILELAVEEGNFWRGLLPLILASLLGTLLAGGILWMGHQRRAGVE